MPPLFETFTAQVAGHSFEIPRYTHRRGVGISQEQADAERAALSAIDEMMAKVGKHERQPGDEFEAVDVPPKRRTAEQNEQDFDFVAAAARVIAKQNEQKAMVMRHKPSLDYQQRRAMDELRRSEQAARAETAWKATK